MPCYADVWSLWPGVLSLGPLRNIQNSGARTGTLGRLHGSWSLVGLHLCAELRVVAHLDKRADRDQVTMRCLHTWGLASGSCRSGDQPILVFCGFASLAAAGAAG